jgi:hypothetical protein
MLRLLSKIIALFILVVAGSFGIIYYRDHSAAERQIAELEQEKIQLQQFVQRLTSERRVAQLLVTDQHQVAGVLQTSLILKEFSRDGSDLPFKAFTIEGNEVHVDALVIKFDHDLIEHDDPLRGHSIALFTELYGRHQTPAQGFPIDAPGRVPDFYRDADPRADAFETKLWANFWKLADDSSYRSEKRIRVANGQGVWFPVEFGKLYTITLESDGGLNVTPEPLQGDYRELLKHHPILMN